MKKLYLPIIGIMLFLQQANAQLKDTVWREDFNNISSFTATPPTSWKANTIYYLPDSIAANSKSYHGLVLSRPGDTSILESPIYDCTPYEYVYLWFSHICKVAPSDIVRIEYRINSGNTMGAWGRILPADFYMGKASNYHLTGFNAESYPEWEKDSIMALPKASWWKEEFFELQGVASTSRLQFRFIIIHGNTIGSHASYGWLLDNVVLRGATYELVNPTVEFIKKVSDTVFHTGAWEINAKVKTNTMAGIEPPYLKYKAVLGTQTDTGTLKMENVGGDSLWKANIPKFSAGSEVTYSITGRDSTGNEASISAKYVIKLPPPGPDIGYVILGNGSVIPGTYKETMPINMNYKTSWSRQIYFAGEINSGVITHLAWEQNHVSGYNLPNQRCYFKAVDNDNDITDRYYRDPNVFGGTLVWQGTFSSTASTTARRWVEIKLDNPFVLPQGKHLVVYWINEHGAQLSNYPFYHTTPAITTDNTLSYNYSDYGLNYDEVNVVNAVGKTKRDRPNVRLYIIGGPDIENSASMATIHLDNIISLSPNTPIPIVVTVENKGSLPLSSATISYRINANQVKDTVVQFNPALSWNLEKQITLGQHNMQVGKFDTVVAWVKLPNGQADAHAFDDTLTKIIYGQGDIVMTFVEKPANIVYTTSPCKISANISTISGALLPTTISLYVASDLSGTIKYDTISMLYQGSNIWTCYTDYKQFGSNVKYKITLRDSRNNIIEISDEYNVVRQTVNPTAVSVALDAIVSPKSSVETNVPEKILVRIQNIGYDNLDSCLIEWSFNGVLQTPPTVYKKTNGLPEGFIDTITIGTYYPVNLGKADTIVIWVSMPNNIIDPITSDDTLEVYPKGCATGIITVGVGKEYTLINDVLTFIRSCNAVGDITLVLSGTFNETLDLSNFSTYMNGYHLTLTSAGNHPDSAIIRSTSTTSTMTLNKTNNLSLLSITVEATTAYGLHFTGACNNIMVRDCKLLANPLSTSTTNAPVFKDASSSSGFGLSNASFIKNTFNGGEHGIYVYGGGALSYFGELGSYIIFDSNLVTNSRSNGIRIQNTTSSRCAYNTVLSREGSTNTNTTWYGIYVSTFDSPVIGNKVIQRTNEITTPFGIHVAAGRTNTYPVFVVNNEIILNYTSGTCAGINTTGTGGRIYHNSIYITGSGLSRGIQFNPSDIKTEIINNNIITPNGIGIYAYTTELGYPHIDYNNYYGTYIGYYYDVHVSEMSAWRQRFNTDWNSVQIMPDFPDIANNSLKLASYKGFTCLALPAVTEDKETLPRVGITTMGCYEAVPDLSGNAAVTEIAGLRSGVVAGEQNNVQTVVWNLGSSQITSIAVEWSVNGTSQGVINHSASLAKGGSTIINLGQITYPEGNVEVKVWIKNLNGGMLVEEFPQDDTLSTSLITCYAGKGVFDGVVTIGKGPGNDYQTIAQALSALSTCGAKGDVTFSLKAGTYGESVNLTNVSNYMNGYRLTITSFDNDADAVSISPTLGTGTYTYSVLLNNSNNLTLKALTISAVNGSTYTLQFGGACNDVLIRDCKLLHSTSTTNSYHFVVYKATATGVASNISFINNVIDGGYTGVSFAGGTGTSAYATNIVFDSNTVSNHYYYGVDPQYVNFTSCSYNTISTRTTMGTTWHGLRLANCNGNIIGNRIKQLVNSTTSRGIVLSNTNINNTTESALIANNELIMFGSANTARAIDITTSRAKIVHNAIYTSSTGTSAAVGIYITSAATNQVVIKNNIISLSGTGAHPIYLSAATNLTTYSFDYNNLYTSGTGTSAYVGYVGSARLIDAWRTQLTSISADVNSIRENPGFTSTSQNLELSTYTNAMLCPAQGVLKDAKGLFRNPLLSLMGAYEYPPVGTDLMPQQISPSLVEVINNQTIPISINILNVGATPVDTVTLGWKINGQLQPNVKIGFTSSLNSYEQQEVMLSSITIKDTVNSYNITAWIEYIDGAADPNKWNDTISKTYLVKPIAEFVSPIVSGNISNLSFEVKARIREFTGAPLTAPEMRIETVVNNMYSFYSTVPMTQSGDIWTANIPKQYYSSKVVYSIQAEDLLGNNITIKDSVNIVFGTGSTNKYPNHNLTLLSVKSPANTADKCAPDYLPLSVILANTGEQDYNFMFDTVAFWYEVNVYPNGGSYKGYVPVRRGALLSGKMDTVELMSALPMLFGRYDIKTWFNNPLDSIQYDDTLFYTYQSGKIALPLDEYFGGNILTSDFVSIPLSGQKAWEVYHPDTATFPVKPYQGNGMLRYDGEAGKMALFTVKQLDIFGVVNPKMYFWYYHDSTTAEIDDSRTDVYLVVDNVANKAFSLFKRSNTHGWKQYTIDLNPYINAQCIYMEFESMNKSNVNPGQYIGRIYITSDQDLAVREILVKPQATVCSLGNKDVHVVLSAMSNHLIDFTEYPNSITLDISGTKYTKILSKAINGYMSDTILVAQGVDFKIGTNNLKAYLNTSIDNNSANDTATFIQGINPSISVTAKQVSENNNCLLRATKVQQEVKIKNTGDVKISGIGLVLDVILDNVYLETIRETKNVDILPDSSATILFNTSYTTPIAEGYIVSINAFMVCDSASVNNSTSLQECVDMNDLVVRKFASPQEGVIDTIGTSQEISIYIKNESDTRAYTDIIVRAWIEDATGEQTGNELRDIILKIEPLDSVLFVFKDKYTVPNQNAYYVKAFINSWDSYPENDTLSMRRETVTKDSIVGIETHISAVFALEQNIPNPTDNITRIAYTIPALGEVTFKIHTVSGQLLYHQVIQSESGKQTIELNTEDFAAGVYLYSLEYKGQKLIKRMIVKK